VDLNVRGICCLRPGIEGVSENIRVNSVVGRFLEHSRVFAFERDDETRVYMGSADLMPRNLDHRVELVTPVEEPSLRGELVDVVERSLADNTNGWVLDADGRWRRRQPGDQQPRNLQAELCDLHEARAAEHLAASGD
jgi:polyphosphate kinase